jgi:hypothetical protein
MKRYGNDGFDGFTEQEDGPLVYYAEVLPLLAENAATMAELGQARAVLALLVQEAETHLITTPWGRPVLEQARAILAKEPGA